MPVETLPEHDGIDSADGWCIGAGMGVRVLTSDGVFRVENRARLIEKRYKC